MSRPNSGILCMYTHNKDWCRRLAKIQIKYGNCMAAQSRFLHTWELRHLHDAESTRFVGRCWWHNSSQLRVCTATTALDPPTTQLYGTCSWQTSRRHSMYLKRTWNQTISTDLPLSGILSLVLSSLTWENICAKLSPNITWLISTPPPSPCLQARRVTWMKIGMVTKICVFCISRSPAASTMQHSSGPSLCLMFLNYLVCWAAQPKKICPSPDRLSSTSGVKIAFIIAQKEIM